MKSLSRLFKIIVHPRQTAQELVQETGIRSSLVIVVGFGIFLTILFAISALAHDYPPPQQDLQTWINTWGEFAMLPFLKIPAESYRLAEAIFILPLVLAVWMLMAGSARLLSILFGGSITFDQYLNLFGFSFFTFWILAQLLEMIIERLLGAYMLPALRSEYGPLARGFFAYFLSIEWTLLLTIGGVYNALVTWFSERFAIWKAVMVGMVTLSWPIVLVTILLR